MKFFLDTADLDEIEEAAKLGCVGWRNHQSVFVFSASAASLMTSTTTSSVSATSLALIAPFPQNLLL